MSECGGCRHWKIIESVRVESSDLGICEREDWTPSKILDVRSMGLDEGMAHGNRLNDTRRTHYKHILSSTHPAPPCYEGKMKTARLLHQTLCPGENDSCIANDDIKKGEEVEIV